jgi:hypothetical protein
MTHHLRITDWPDTVPPPGPDFDLKKLSATALGELVDGHLENQKNKNYDKSYPRIERWTQRK